jgi:tetratricopeptide (TPR) repeat protein
MMLRGALLALALCALVAGGAAAQPPTPTQQEELARADALLENQSGWDEAIALYRSLLAENADWMEPRLALARVLGWRGEYKESLEHFERVAQSPSAPPELTIERAEVLSWAGRNDEARVLFEQTLAAKPDDPRATRGLARTYAWSGQRTRANIWYDRAIQLEDDAEARQEWDALRGELKNRVGANGFWFHDSEQFTYIRSGLEASKDIDFDTRVYATTAAIFISHDRGEDDVLAGSPTHDTGIDGRLGVERRFSPRWKGIGEVGGRGWEHGDDFPVGRAVLEYAPDESAVAAVEIAHEDQLERSYSLEGVLRGIQRSSGKLSYWTQITPTWEGYVEGGGAYLNDSNNEESLGGSVAWRPFRAIDMQIALALDAMHYAEFSPYYYSPEVDVGGTVSLMGRVPIYDTLAFVFDGGGGAGFSKEQGASEFGPAYRVKLGLRWDRGGVSVALDAARSQSVRASAYTTHEAALRVSWSF